ncbi:MAG: flagellar biosynthesis anti-sigma factor FlgM [Desulfovibrionaceae bacterium]|nr:flagellar biosynthesis anti-sigma factor FlgM [Desulfovibrionaceae bacterium]
MSESRNEQSPVEGERGRRLRLLAAQLADGSYRPDLETLARKLLEKEPQLFGLSSAGSGSRENGTAGGGSPEGRE